MGEESEGGGGWCIISGAVSFLIHSFIFTFHLPTFLSRLFQNTLQIVNEQRQVWLFGICRLKLNLAT